VPVPRGVYARKRPTIADIAELAGVSSGAVSYALNGRPGVSVVTRQRILAVADEIGWRPNVAARALSVSRAHAVGWVIARELPTVGVEPFFMQFMSGMEAELSAARTALLLQVVDDHTAAIDAIRRWWAERRIDGGILTDIWSSDARVRVLDELGIPAVLVGRPVEGSPLPAVWSDERLAVASVVDYLVALGHRRIARVAGLRELAHTVRRTEAFRTAVARHNLPEPRVLLTDYSREQGAQATRRLLSQPDRPTAITFDNDVMAVAAIGVAREFGLSVPDDLSIVAGDDSELCILVSPSITALSRDIVAYAGRAARVLLDSLEGLTAESFEDSPAHLVVRSSTAPARHPS